MVEDVSLDKLTVLATFQCQCVTTVGVHQYELDILLLIEIAILLHELIVILIEVFAQMFTRLMCLCLVVIELLVCLRKSYIQHGAFLLFRFEVERCEGSSVLADFGQKTYHAVLNYH